MLVKFFDKQRMMYVHFVPDKLIWVNIPNITIAIWVEHFTESTSVA